MMTLVSTRDMPRGEWLEHRKTGIGGSDAAAIVGMNPYVTPFALWADKTGRMPAKEDNEAMRQGRDLEQYVADRFTEQTGKKVRRRNQILRNEEYPFAHANIDRDVIGERAGLECKTTTSLNLRKFRNGEFPDTYYTQCVHYLAVTGYDRWYLAVLIFGTDFKVFTIERDEEEIAALMEAEKFFWNSFVLPDVPPAVDGMTPTGDAINAMYANPAGGSTLLARSKELDELAQMEQQEKLLKRLIEKTKQQIKSDLGECTEGICPGWKITWKPQTRTRFDVNRFAKDNPGIDLSKYYTASTSRVLRIKEDK
ncbi:MAG TPA: hypothetical protein DDX59_06620 [Lachnospiraceae bacterium]|nr:hypothetical protein [Lachnospiraceae bacterium]